MNSSRGWGDDPEQGLVETGPEFRRYLTRGVLLLLVLILAAASARFAWRAVRSRCEPLLVEAQGLVRAAAEQPSESDPQLRQAEELLREYLRRGGRRQGLAQLLLSADLKLRSSYDLTQGIGMRAEIDRLLDSTNPATCTLPDLLDAIDIFIRCRQLAPADWLIGAALKTSSGTSDHSRVLRVAARLRYDLGREDDVLDHCRQLAALEPQDPEPWRLLAMVYEDGGYEESMIEALEKVLALDHGDTAAERLKLISSLITVGQRERAREHYATLVTQAPESARQHPLLEARLLMLEGATEQSAAIIDRALAADPESLEAMLLRSQLLLSQRELDQALPILERLLAIDPMNFQAQYLIGQAYARSGDRQRAQQHLDLHQRILDTRVKIHGLERRAGRNPDDLEARTELIGLYESLGMAQHAEFWRRAVASASNEAP